MRLCFTPAGISVLKGDVEFWASYPWIGVMDSQAAIGAPIGVPRIWSTGAKIKIHKAPTTTALMVAPRDIVADWMYWDVLITQSRCNPEYLYNLAKCHILLIESSVSLWKKRFVIKQERAGYNMLTTSFLITCVAAGRDRLWHPIPFEKFSVVRFSQSMCLLILFETGSGDNFRI